MTQFTPKYQVGDIVKESDTRHYLIKRLIEEGIYMYYNVYTVETGYCLMLDTDYFERVTQKV